MRRSQESEQILFLQTSSSLSSRSAELIIGPGSCVKQHYPHPNRGACEQINAADALTSSAVISERDHDHVMIVSLLSQLNWRLI